MKVRQFSSVISSFATFLLPHLAFTNQGIFKPQETAHTAREVAIQRLTGFFAQTNRFLNPPEERQVVLSHVP